LKKIILLINPMNPEIHLNASEIGAEKT